MHALLIALALCVVAAIFYSAIDWRARWMCALILCGDLVLSLRRHRRMTGILLWRVGDWLWIDRQGAQHVLHLRDAVLWPALIVLRFRVANSGKARTFVLLRDGADADAQRRLRMHLRHMPVFGHIDTAADSAARQ